jgi:hypothetical protein
MRPITIATLSLAAVPLLMLGACQKRVEAPSERGVCYFIGHVKKTESPDGLKFNIIARDQPDIEHCAVQLYNTRRSMLLTGTAGEATEGAYQGNYLLATNSEVRESEHYEGPYLPFLVKAPDDRLVTPGSIVEDDTQGDGPQKTVAVPKDLPKLSQDQKK